MISDGRCWHQWAWGSSAESRTVHLVRLHKVLVLQVHARGVGTENPDVLLQVPAEVLVYNAEQEKEVVVHVDPLQLGVASRLVP